MGFHDRNGQHEKLKTQVIKYYESSGGVVTPFGEEENPATQSSGWQQRKKLPDAMRYRPDLHVQYESREFLVDPKTGNERFQFIQKEAYENYLEYNEFKPTYTISNCVKLAAEIQPQYKSFNPITGETIIRLAQHVGICQITDMKFLDSEIHVSQFSDPFPIDSDGWIQPPRGSRTASGTPYKLVDPFSYTSICTIEDWVKLFGE